MDTGAVKYVASCSFGKDSLATILLSLMHNEPLDEVVYCEVMFDDGVSGEVPEHRDFIYSRAIPFLERNGVNVVVLRSEMTYIDSFYRVLKKDGQRDGLTPGRCADGAASSGTAKLPLSTPICAPSVAAWFSTSASPMTNRSGWRGWRRAKLFLC